MNPVAGPPSGLQDALWREPLLRQRLEERWRESEPFRGAAPPRARALADAVAGAFFGYAVLHPVSMLIFAYLDPRLAHAAGGAHGSGAWAAFTHSFAVEMLPMGAVFALFTAVIAVANGHYRRALAAERDLLARELERNEWLRAGLTRQAETLQAQNTRLERLEATNRRHAQFMAHDLKGRLQVILGDSAALLEDGALREDSAAVASLERIRRQAVRMNAAVHDLLDFARLQESPCLRRERIAVSELLHRSAEDAALPSQLGSVSVGEQHRACPDITGDARVLGRVLVNLAANALKHNRRGTKVEIDAHVGGAGNEVIFTCIDDGQGVPAEVQASLFNAFAAGEPASAADSTGLGLAFCKAAVEAHGGRIWCESAEGRGARFSFSIPLGGKGVDDDEERTAAHPSRGR